MKNLFKQTSAAILWVLITLIALEVLLQIGALVVKENSWRAKTHWLTGNVRILALGDSNTYGLYLPEQNSYPAQLEKQWNSQHPELPVEIINLGYPGTNSFRLLANMPEILDTFKPDLVLLQIGFNDFWTPVEPSANTPHLSWIQKIQYRSRIYKLAHMIFQKQEMQEEVDTGERMLGGNNVSQADILNTVKVGDKTFSLGIAEGSSAGNSKHMEQNLSSMLILLNERNTNYFLINYPSNHGYYPAANRKIQKVAEQTQSRFINLDTTFAQDCRNKPETCPELFFYDGHASASGNHQISTTVMQHLEDYFHLQKK